MPSNLCRVVVIGGSGNLGRYVVDALVADPFFDVTVIRRQSSEKPYQPQKAQIVTVADDYPMEELTRAFEDQDAVVASVNFRANQYQRTIVDAAIKAGIKRLIPSDFGSNAETPALLELDPRLKAKGAETDYLRAKESSGLTWTSIITGLFADMAILNGFMGYDLKNRAATIWDAGSEKFSTSICPTIAATVAAVLKNPEKTKNRYVYTSSVETTQNEILKELECQTDSEWKVQRVNSDEMIVVAKDALNRGDFFGGAKLALAASYSGKYGGNFSAVGKLDNDLLGVPSVSITDIVAEALRKAQG